MAHICPVCWVEIDFTPKFHNIRQHFDQLGPFHPLTGEVRPTCSGSHYPGHVAIEVPDRPARFSAADRYVRRCRQARLAETLAEFQNLFTLRDQLKTHPNRPGAEQQLTDVAERIHQLTQRLKDLR
jgi:rRNA maturation protein Nop10